MRHVCLYHLQKQGQHYATITVEDRYASDAPRIVGCVHLKLGPTVDKLIFHRWLDSSKAGVQMRGSSAESIALNHGQERRSDPSGVEPDSVFMEGTLYDLCSHIFLLLIVDYCGADGSLRRWVRSYFDLGISDEEDFCPREVPEQTVLDLIAAQPVRETEQVQS